MTKTKTPDLSKISLSSGGHPSADAGVCVMEAVAWIAGEKHSAEPSCACPVITRTLIRINDAMPDNATRDKFLKPLIPLIIGTRSSPEVEIRRAFISVDWTVRIQVPLLFDAAGYKPEAEKLRNLAAIQDTKNVEEARTAVQDVYQMLMKRPLARALARARALDLARARALDLALDLARARALDLARARARARALDLARARALDLALDLDLDLDLTPFWQNEVKMVEAMIAVKLEVSTK